MYTIDHNIEPETCFANAIGRTDIVAYPKYPYLVTMKSECIAVFNELKITGSLRIHHFRKIERYARASNTRIESKV